MTSHGVTLSNLKAVISNLEQVHAQIEQLQKSSTANEALRLHLHEHEESLAGQMVSIAMRYHSNLPLEWRLKNRQRKLKKSTIKNHAEKASWTLKT